MTFHFFFVTPKGLPRIAHFILFRFIDLEHFHELFYAYIMLSAVSLTPSFSKCCWKKEQYSLRSDFLLL